MTVQLVMDAPVMTNWRRGNADALLHHFDRGSQYGSGHFQRLMAANGVVRAISRSGNVWDKCGDGGLSLLPEDRARGTTTYYQSRDEAKVDVFDYVERFYNSRPATLDDPLSKPFGV